MTDSQSLVLLVTSVSNRADATRLARSLVEEGLAACVSTIPGVRSLYRWKGSVEEEEETLLLVKTTAAARDAARGRILQLHPYELPELLVLDEVQASEAYAAWVFGEVCVRPAP